MKKNQIRNTYLRGVPGNYKRSDLTVTLDTSIADLETMKQEFTSLTEQWFERGIYFAGEVTMFKVVPLEKLTEGEIVWK